MITPEDKNQEKENLEGKSREEENQEKKNKKTVFKETLNEGEELSSGETSSAADLDRSEFTRGPERKNKPLGAGHEPGTTPGRDF